MAFSCVIVLKVRKIGEGLQGHRPVAIEPIAHRPHAAGINAINPPRSLGRLADQARVLKHPQMLGDGWPTDRQVARQFPHRQWPSRQACENRPAGRIAQGAEG